MNAPSQTRVARPVPQPQRWFLPANLLATQEKWKGLVGRCWFSYTLKYQPLAPSSNYNGLEGVIFKGVSTNQYKGSLASMKDYLGIARAQCEAQPVGG